MRAFLLGCVFALAALTQPTRIAAATAAETAAVEDAVPHQISQTDRTIVEHIRLLFRLQDASANGDRHAVEGQQAELAEIRDLLAARPEGDAGSLAALVAGFVLSGGDPALADKLAAADGLPPTMRALLEGSALFMSGKQDEARKSLAGLNPDLLPDGIAGRVLLAQALLAEDSAKRQQFLSGALSAMPGSLIEESALRRSALAYLEDGNIGSTLKRLMRYQRRFGRSIFAGSFERTIVRKLVEKEAAGLHLADEMFDGFLNELPMVDRRNLLLALTQDAAALNLVPRTEFARRRLKRLAVPGSEEDQIADLYGAIFAIAGPQASRAVEILRALDRSRLPQAEQALLAAGLAVGAEIERPIKRMTLDDAANQEASPTAELEKKVEAQIEAADSALVGLTQ